VNIPVDQLTANEFALRTVDIEDSNVLLMFDNIAQVGVLLPIRVRAAVNADNKTPKLTDDGRQVYQVIDGLHRFTGAVRAKLEKVPCIVVSADDAQVEREQMMANLHRIPTKHYEYGKHLNKILGRDRTKTLSELAGELNVSTDYIEKRMGLSGLHKDGVDAKGEPTSSIGVLVDQGKIPLANAVVLAKLRPSDKQLDFVTDAMTMTAQLFDAKIKALMTELRKAKAAGQDPSATVGFAASAHYRAKKDAEQEVALIAEGKTSTLSVLLQAKGITDPLAAARFAIEWALQLDEQSVQTAKAKHEAREKARAAELIARKEERAAKAHAEAVAAKAKVGA